MIDFENKAIKEVCQIMNFFRNLTLIQLAILKTLTKMRIKNKMLHTLTCLSLRTEQTNLEVFSKLSIPCLSFLILGRT